MSSTDGTARMITELPKYRARPPCVQAAMKFVEVDLAGSRLAVASAEVFEEFLHEPLLVNGRAVRRLRAS